MATREHFEQRPGDRVTVSGSDDGAVRRHRPPRRFTDDEAVNGDTWVVSTQGTSVGSRYAGRFGSRLAVRV